MGDFDRVETSAKGGETKKKAMLGALGAVLLVVVGYHYMKPGPQSAMGATPDGAIVAPVAVEETAEKVRAELQRDPTAELLLRPAADSGFAHNPPRNPFRLSKVMRTALVKPEVIPEPVDVTPVQVVSTGSQVPPPPRAVAIKVENYKLSGIMHVGNAVYAVINDHQVTPGMIIDRARVLEVREDGVLLQHADFPEGPKTFIKTSR